MLDLTDTLFVIMMALLIIVIVLAFMIAVLRADNRSMRHSLDRVVPAYVDATLALTDSERTTRDILSLVPMPDRGASDAELDAVLSDRGKAFAEQVDVALAIVDPTPPPMLVPEHRSTTANVVELFPRGPRLI